MAISTSEQVKGYGTRLMNRLKAHAQTVGIQYFVTYADNNAIEYFRKQGFTKHLQMPETRWKGYIKDYSGSTMMQCKIHKGIDYENESYDDIFYMSSWGEFNNYMLNKLSPLAAFLYKLKAKQHPTKFRGDIEDATAFDYMESLFLPLTITELMEGIEEGRPISKLAFDTLLTIYGVSVQNYGEDKEEEDKVTITKTTS